MAWLDVSEVIRDPAFTSPVLLVKSVESEDEAGNPVWLDGAVGEVDAVVTADAKTIARLPDALRREGTILVRFMAGDAPEGFQGGGYDAVVWRGRRFAVKDCADYSHFGDGFLRLVCAPEEASDGGY